MTQSRNAVSNLIARYKSILKNCNLVNTFGSLAAATVLAGAMVLGGAGAALAADLSGESTDNPYYASDKTIAADGTATYKVDGAAFTLDRAMTITTDYTDSAEGAKGKLAIEGWLTQTESGSDISGVDVSVSIYSSSTGGLVLANDLTIGTLNLGNGTYISLYTVYDDNAPDSNNNDREELEGYSNVEVKTLTIADGGLLTFEGNTTIKNSSGSNFTDLEFDAASLLINGEGSISIEGSLLVQADTDIQVATTISTSGTLTVSDANVTATTIDNKGSIALSGGNSLIADSIANSGDITIGGPLSTFTVTELTNTGTTTINNGTVTVGTITNGTAAIAAVGEEGTEGYVAAIDAVSGAITVSSGTLIADSIDNVAGVITVSGGTLVVNNGLYVGDGGSDAYCNFASGSVIALGSGIDMSGMSATDVATILANDNGNFGANLVTTYIKFDTTDEDLTDLTLSNGARTTILGDGSDGAFTNYEGDLTVDGSSTLNLGTINSKYLSYAGEDYNQGGTFAGAIEVVSGSTLNVNAGEWTIGALDVSGTASVASDASLAVSSLTNTGTTTISGTLSVDMSGANADYVGITNTGTLTFVDGSTLYVAGAIYDDSEEDGDNLLGTLYDGTGTLTLVDSEGNASEEDLTVKTDNLLLAISYDAEDGFSAERLSASSMIDDLDNTYDGHLNNYNTGDNSFLDTVLNTNFKGNRAKAIDSAMKTGAAGGVGPAVGAVGAAGGKNIAVRTGSSSAQAFNDQDTSKMLAMSGDGSILPMDKAQEGFGIWAMPMYSHTSADGFKSGDTKYGYDTDLFGVTLGADYTFASSLRLGLAFNIGSGESDSSGDFASTENDFDYVGIAAYGSMSFGQFTISGDIGYIASDNEISQGNAAGSMDADVDASLTTLGVKGEYQIPLSGFNVTPYAGIRVNYYDIDSFNTKSGGASIAHTSSSDYTIVEFPIGLTFDTTMDAGGWDLTPSLGLGVKFAAGDLDPEQKASFTGVDGNVVFSSEVADEVTFQGALGLSLAKDVYSLSLGYTLDLSENVESHGVNLNLRYEF